MAEPRPFQVGDVVSFIDKHVRRGDDWYLQPERWGTVIASRTDMDYVTVDWRDLGVQGPFFAEHLRLRTPVTEEEKA